MRRPIYSEILGGARTCGGAEDAESSRTGENAGLGKFQPALNFEPGGKMVWGGENRGEEETCAMEVTWYMVKRAKEWRSISLGSTKENGETKT